MPDILKSNPEDAKELSNITINTLGKSVSMMTLLDYKTNLSCNSACKKGINNTNNQVIALDQLLEPTGPYLKQLAARFQAVEDKYSKKNG